MLRMIMQRDGNGEERIAQGDGVPEEASRHRQRPLLLDFDALFLNLDTYQ